MSKGTKNVGKVKGVSLDLPTLGKLNYYPAKEAGGKRLPFHYFRRETVQGFKGPRSIKWIFYGFRREYFGHSVAASIAICILVQGAKNHWCLRFFLIKAVNGIYIQSSYQQNLSIVAQQYGFLGARFSSTSSNKEVI